MYQPRRFASLATSLVLLAVGAGAAHAESTIYKCVDGEGRVEFTDIVKKNCKALDLPSTIPAPARARTGGGNGRAATQTAAAAPADFPKVSSNQQKARDDERRDILNDELRNEEKKLAELRREFNGGEPERQGNEKNYAKYQERVALLKDNIGRTEKNVDALRREISNIK